MLGLGCATLDQLPHFDPVNHSYSDSGPYVQVRLRPRRMCLPLYFQNFLFFLVPIIKREKPFFGGILAFLLCDSLEVCNNERKLFQTYWHWKEAKVYFNPVAYIFHFLLQFHLQKGMQITDTILNMQRRWAFRERHGMYNSKSLWKCKTLNSTKF